MFKPIFPCFMMLVCTQFVYIFLFFIMIEVRTASLNLNGARERSKRAAVFESIRQNRVDVLLAQETHTDTSNAADWAQEFDGLSILSHNTSNSGGVAILFSRSFTPISYQAEEIVKGRLLKVRAQFENIFFVFLCVYAPTKATDRMVFLTTLNTVLSSCDPEDILLLGGDFNCTEQMIDRNHIEPHMPSRRRLIEVMKSNDLVDMWRLFHKEQRQYTWVHSFNNLLSLARLDRFYSFKHQRSMFTNCNIVPFGFSDHSLVICSLSISAVKPKSAYWHFNTNLLCDGHFRDVFHYFWNDFRSSKASFKSLQQWWDCAKAQIKLLCQEYTAYVTSDITRLMRNLENEITELQNSADQTGNQTHTKDLKAKKKSLADLLGLKAQGALVRSRFQSVELMDAPSKFFFNLEKKNGQKRLIHALRSEDGVLMSDFAEIRKRAVSFYKELYKKEIPQDGVDNSAFLNNLPQLSEEANADLERPLTLEELYSALQTMDSGKASGLDGLPVAFYKSFWAELGTDVLTVLSDSLSEGQLPLSCRRAVLTLIPKKGDLSDIRSWRPVSVLCTEYKLLSKALAIRLGDVLGQVIHPDQTYCVPGRLIQNNISFIRDIVDLGKSFNLEFGLVSIDQEKAFDRVDHSYLWSTLAAFGFSPDFINKIQVLYCGIQSILKVNGDLCAPFKVHRGVRQGCALSGMLYSLAIEPLLVKLRKDLLGVGIPNCDHVFKLSAYADDVAVLVSGQRDINMMLKMFDDFRGVSSAKVNWLKSVAMLVGNWSDGEPSLPDGLTWTRNGFKYLGVFLGNDLFIQKNFEGVVEKIKGRLDKWTFLLHKTSYKGRVLIVNNLVASSLWHRLACVDPPTHLLSKIQSILVDFFWDKLHWVPQSVLFLPKEEGGHGLVQLQSRTAAFRVQFLQRLLTGTVDSNWKYAACAILQTFDGLGLDRPLVWMDPKTLNLSKFPVFYRNLFKVWSLFTVQQTRSVMSLHWLLKEPLIHGSALDIAAEKPLPNLEYTLVKAGVTTLGDLLQLAGPDLRNSGNVADHLGMRSTRIVAQLLKSWWALLTREEREMLGDYVRGLCSPDCKDPFPNFILSPNLTGCTGFCCSSEHLIFLGPKQATGKDVYKLCVKMLNKKVLDKRVDTPWRSVLQIGDVVRPQWRALYKSPLPKKAGDLQWRILHGAIAVNAFISVLNPDVGQDCPFCFLRETVFHVFMQCVRLKPLFVILQALFVSLNEPFSMETFILGFKYVQKHRFKCQLINFLLGQAKMAIYVSRRNKIEQMSSDDMMMVFSILVRSRVLIDFNFYKAMKDLEPFKEIWCYNSVLCVVKDDNLRFAQFLENAG